MTITSVSDFLSFINKQIKAQERIESCLWNLEALMAVVLTMDDFYDLPKSILHTYFSLNDDLIKEALKENQASLAELLSKTDISKTI